MLTEMECILSIDGLFKLRRVSVKFTPVYIFSSFFAVNNMKELAIYAGGLHHLTHQCVKTVPNIVNYYPNLVSRVKSNTITHSAAT